MLLPKLKILIADDDEGDRKLLKRTLEQAGMSCECKETASVEEALGACQSASFDCVFVEYRLPGQDGLAGVSALRSRYPHMAMIMLTGQGDELVAAEALKRGAFDYIPKRHVQAEVIRNSVINAMEKACQQRNAAQQQDMLATFNRLLVHDLKDPMQSIQSFAKLIEEGLDRDTPEEIAMYSRVIQEAAVRNCALIDMLHQYASADDLVEFGSVDMGAAMEAVLFNLANVIRRRGAFVTHGRLPFVLGNAPQLTQLLQNLIANALKYCAADLPTVRLEVGLKQGRIWLFSLKDNGIGIPAGQRERIFEPFHRLHGVGKYEGTGLGLATCRKIIDRHGSRIWCESNEGQGSTFYFTLNEVKSPFWQPEC